MAPVGYATLVNTAETAWQQGVDLYGEEQDRLIAGTQVIIQRYLSVDLHLYATRYSSTAFAFKYPKVGRSEGIGELTWWITQGRSSTLHFCWQSQNDTGDQYHKMSAVARSKETSHCLLVQSQVERELSASHCIRH